MRFRNPAAIPIAFVGMFAMLLTHCRSAGTAPSGPTPAGPATAGLADRMERLPALPPDIASTLDPATQATRIRLTQLTPVRDPGAALAPCCGSKEQKTLQVRVPLTRCAPLRDFLVARLDDLVLTDAAPAGGSGGRGGVPEAGEVGAAGSDVRLYRRGTVNRATVFDTIVCMTSSGPWTATFTEDRNCNGYMPQDSLIVSAWGQLYPYNWNGGVAEPPARGPGRRLPGHRPLPFLLRRTLVV